VAEGMIEANGVALCTEAFGESADPPLLLVMGVGASMLWWEEGFCRLLAEGGRFVIRYDHRDTGRSVTYEPGRPQYTGADLITDAVGVLDAYELPAAHVVGVSAGGAFAQLLALDYPDRVLSLVLVSTSPATAGERRLPSATDRVIGFLASAEVDRSDRESVIEYVVAYARMLAGGVRPFDEVAWRELVRRDVERARDVAASENHNLIPEGDVSSEPISSIAVPTLVIHGTADPMFPPAHGQALAEEIPGARLLTLAGAGHGVDRADWETVANAILEHTAAADRKETMTMQPVTELDPRFSDQNAAATDWEETRRVLEEAELFWISTVRADGRPHVTPLVAVWLDDAIHFATGPAEQKAVNLRANRNVILMTGCNEWERGLDVVVEGEAVQVTDESVLGRLAETWALKWDGRWHYEVHEGGFQHEGGSGEVLVFSVKPVKVLAFAKGTAFAQTRHRFRADSLAP
jgi:pimeloyl-ACP methyl ester carboxylesterase/nitroimidazol reductase NimA-like FMN-containing flavoprotein (pyridoxamine 5'-phosphate oxidase superfamily)